MKFKTGELFPHGDQAGGQHPPDRKPEIELYSDLAAFSQLSPDEQEAFASRWEEPARQTPAPAQVPAEIAGGLSPRPASRAEPGPPPGAEGVFFFGQAEEAPRPAEAASAGPAAESSPPRARIGTGELLSAFNVIAEPEMFKTPAGAKNVKCPACGCDSDETDLFCISCGAFIEEPAKTAPAAAAPDANAPDIDAAAGSACGDCGAAVAPGELFCPECGGLV